MLKKYVIDVCTIIISLFTLFPNLTGDFTMRLLVILSSLTILIVTFSNTLKARDIPFLRIVLLIVIAVTISLLTGIKYSINHYIYIGIYIIFIPIYVYYREHNFIRVKFIFLLLTFLLIVAAVQTIQILEVQFNYSRLLTKNDESVDVYGLSGGYGLVYASVLAFFSFIILAVKSKYSSRILQIVFMITSIILLVFIWKAGFFLALLLIILGSTLLFLSVNKIISIKSILFSMIFILLGVVFSNSIEGFILSQVKGTQYERKVNQILVTNDDISYTDGEFEERGNRYSRDLKLLLEYPIIGCWDRLKTGKHSYILDNLAEYGLFFGSFFIYIIFLVPYKTLKRSKGLGYSQSIVFNAVLFVFLLFNSNTMSLTPIIFIIFPYSNYLLRIK